MSHVRGILGERDAAEAVHTLSLLDSTTLFLVARLGPLHFSVRDEEARAFKVTVGDPHSCSCGAGRCCVHVLFVVVKVLRVPASNDLALKKGYSDAELAQVLDGAWEVAGAPRQAFRPRRRSAAPTHDSGEDRTVRRQALGEDEEVCPICQDCMGEAQALSWCRSGCGANIHARCMHAYAQHRQASGDKASCPLCRAAWDTALLRDDCARKTKATSACASVRCGVCMGAQRGVFYRCLECSSGPGRRPADFCSACFSGLGRAHAGHHLVCSDAACASAEGVSWVGVRNPIARADERAATLLGDLQTRELTADDYGVLLALDGQGDYADLPATLVDSLPSGGGRCGDCGAQPSLRLPCTHALCRLCALLLVRGALAEDARGLDRLLCPALDCRLCVFPGLSRRRRKTLLLQPPAAASPSPTPAPLLLGVAGVCLHPVDARASTHAPPQPVVRLRSHARSELPPAARTSFLGEASSLCVGRSVARSQLLSLPSLRSGSGAPTRKELVVKGSTRHGRGGAWEGPGAGLGDAMAMGMSRFCYRQGSEDRGAL